MTKAPPFLANVSGFGLAPLPNSDWRMFCTSDEAQVILTEARKILPDARLIDILHDDPATFPQGVGPFPVGLYATADTSVSVYILYATQVQRSNTFGAPNVTGIINEFAGVLTDDRLKPNGLDIELGKIPQGTPPDKLALAIYDPPSDQQDPELYWTLLQAA